MTRWVAGDTQHASFEEEGSPPNSTDTGDDPHHTSTLPASAAAAEAPAQLISAIQQMVDAVLAADRANLAEQRRRSFSPPPSYS